ncbi:MAG: hypothetical protein GX749_08330, partial [Ruminococcaceae bacterium]|nr:hypothetical protein [Oscillospiraceae bacterium]
VRLVNKPYTLEQLYDTCSAEQRTIMRQARRCRMCEKPFCAPVDKLDVRGIMRRVAVGNFFGALKRWQQQPVAENKLTEFEANCILGIEGEEPVAIREVLSYLIGLTTELSDGVNI